jgi:hypothetical protein
MKNSSIKTLFYGLTIIVLSRIVWLKMALEQAGIWGK